MFRVQKRPRLGGGKETVMRGKNNGSSSLKSEGERERGRHGFVMRWMTATGNGEAEG